MEIENVTLINIIRQLTNGIASINEVEIFINYSNKLPN